jgi:hypothetical protein
VFQEREDVRIEELVADAGALSSSSDDPGSGQEAEVPGGVLLRHPETLDEFPNGRRPTGEAIDELEAHRLADDAQALGERLCTCVSEV